MEKEFCTYEQALALKELGFDEPCFGSYVRGNEYKDWTLYFEGGTFLAKDYPEFISVPLYQQAFRWFREKYKLVAAITVENDDFDYTIYIPWEIKEEHDSTRFTSYEEAEHACLDKLIEICKTKQD